MREENAIEVKDLKKQFKVYYDKGSQLKEKMLFWKRNRYENRQVLNGISFEVKKGEAVGLIGHNGCGKSTTLKLLTKIIYPTSGTVEMRGRVSSLIELGAGFHPQSQRSEPNTSPVRHSECTRHSTSFPSPISPLTSAT